MQPIYLDHAATTPLEPAAAARMTACHAELVGNPASQHYAGRLARRQLEDARTAIAALLGVDLDRHPADELVLTSGGTESNNLALFGLAGEAPGRILVSSLEHPSVLRPAERLAERGFQLETIAATRDGLLDLADLDRRLAEPSRFVAVTFCNHETGVLQPLDEIAVRCAYAGIPLHVDAAQAVGRTEIDFPSLGATTFAFAAHKFGGPGGIGGLLVRAGTELAPLHFGGFQQHGRRAGSEDVALAVGMLAALEAWDRERPERVAALVALRDQFEAAILQARPTATVQGSTAPRLPHTSNVAFPPLDRQPLFLALDAARVAASTGSACASGSPEPSPTLSAMGLPEGVVRAALRFSFCHRNTPAEVTQAVDRILKACNHLQSKIRP